MSTIRPDATAGPIERKLRLLNTDDSIGSFFSGVEEGLVFCAVTVPAKRPTIRMRAYFFILSIVLRMKIEEKGIRISEKRLIRDKSRQKGGSIRSVMWAIQLKRCVLADLQIMFLTEVRCLATSGVYTHASQQAPLISKI